MYSKKNILLLFIISCLLSQVQAQFSQENLIDNLSSTRTFQIGDVDEDGDLDIIAMPQSSPQEILIYENIDGQGDFSLSDTIISPEITRGMALDLADLDNDGDVDIIFTGGSNSSNSTIGWIENLDGYNNWNIQILSTDINQGIFVKAVDLDGDGDLDIIGSSMGDHKIALYENLNGLGDFSSQQILLQTTIGPLAIDLGDIDQDGDLDLFVTGFYSIQGTWIENINNGMSFEERYFENSLGNNPVRILSGDLDNDGDLDIITANYYDDRVRFYENSDGMFSDPDYVVLLENVFDRTRNMYLEDMDNDGDLDILLATNKDSYQFHALSWFENQNGATDFSTEHIVNDTFNNSSLLTVLNYPDICRPADINNDGKVDIVANRYEGSNKGLVWYENMFNQVLNVQLSLNQDVSCFNASPCDGSATIIASGGTANYTYTWSSGETSNTATQLCQGIQEVTISDGITSLDTFVIIGAPDPLTIEIEHTEPPSSNNNDGLIQVSWTGGNPGMVDFFWDPDVSDNNIAENLSAGVYSVTVTDSKGCSASVSETLLTNSLKEETLAFNWEVFPNPSKEKFNLEIESDQVQTYQIELVNLLGQSIYQFERTASSFNIEIASNKLSPGLYLLKILVNKQTHLTPVIIE